MNKPANDEMLQGFRDGYDPDAPEPNENRSHSYRHGFKAGRNDIAKRNEDRPFHNIHTDRILEMADEAMAKDQSAIAAPQGDRTEIPTDV